VLGVDDPHRALRVEQGPVDGHAHRHQSAQPGWDQPLLDDLARVMEDASICGLGQAAPNPLRCVQRYFAHELDDRG
jgi:NADH:ubiquinone oxidoreductase subunit F (NADH-binding)